MSKNQSVSKREALVRQQPTIYTFDFKNVPADKYAQTLDVLFHNPDFSEAVEKRNRLVKTADRMRPGTNEMMSLARTIQQHDRKLADIMYTSIVQTNLHSDESFDFISFDTLLKYYVDYSRNGMKQNVDKLAGRLDKLTFLADMLETLVTDIKGDMREIFGDNIQFNQFDAVSQVLLQLRGFFKSSRNKNAESPEAQLFFDYSDSINDYLEKRLKTYTDKYRKIHPIVETYTEQDMVAAVNQFCGTENTFGADILKHTESGGTYIDAFALVLKLDKEQTERLDNLVERVDSDKFTDADLKYSFAVSDAIMKLYKRPDKK